MVPVFRDYHTYPCVCVVCSQDMERQQLNVFRMRLMGAEVRPVTSGTATLKDATSQAIRDWVRRSSQLRAHIQHPL